MDDKNVSVDKPEEVIDAEIVEESAASDTSISAVDDLQNIENLINANIQKIDNLEDFSNVVSNKVYSNQSTKTIINTDQGEFIIYSNQSLGITVSSLPKSNIKTGLDLSGGKKCIKKRRPLSGPTQKN